MKTRRRDDPVESLRGANPLRRPSGTWRMAPAPLSRSTVELHAGLGMTLEDLPEGVAPLLGLPEGERGVIVTRVEAAGAAGRAGIEAGDLILEVQGKPVQTARECRALLAKQDLTWGARLLVQSRDSRRFLLLQTQE